MATYAVQTILVPRSHPDVRNVATARKVAKRYARGDAARVGKVDTTPRFYRFRVRAPSAFRAGTFRTYTSPSGVEVVSAVRKARSNPCACEHKETRANPSVNGVLLRFTGSGCDLDGRKWPCQSDYEGAGMRVQVLSTAPIPSLPNATLARLVAKYGKDRVRVKDAPRKPEKRVAVCTPCGVTMLRSNPSDAWSLTMARNDRHGYRLPIRLVDPRGKTHRAYYNASTGSVNGEPSMSTKARSEMHTAARKAYRELYPKGHPDTRR